MSAQSLISIHKASKQCALCIIIGLFPASPVLAEQVIDMGHGVKRVVKGNMVFSYQENLRGIINEVSVNEGRIIVLFTGRFSFHVSGRQLTGPERTSAAGEMTLDIDVIHLPVIITKWKAEDFYIWPLGHREWSETLSRLAQASKDKRRLSLAIRGPELVFGENGDLIGLKGSRIAILNEDDE